jgi:AcrR family transcriptional regulator
VTATTAVPMRRTQAERRASSRTKLLEATVDCLAERGYAGTSLPEVVRRAGLSNGALWRHFRSKAELLAAAGLHAEQGLVGAAAVGDLADLRAPERLDRAVEQMLVWSRQPALRAIIELLVASRSDDELRAALAAMDERSAEIFFRVLADLAGPEVAAHPDFRRNVRVLGLSLYGVALTDHLRRRRAVSLLTDELRGVARQLFDLAANSSQLPGS